MCGIIGYVGKRKDAVGIVLEGLKRLEYRGYDSAGLAAQIEGKIFLKKTTGRVRNLAQKISDKTKKERFNCAIAHTRWATHGVPSVKNSHPHHDCSKKIFVVHNGIIENHKYLKEVLQREGHVFSSATDTEVLAHLIERHKERYNSLEDAVIHALYHVRGTFALAVISAGDPRKIVIARRSSPLIVGLGDGEHFLASDAAALAEYTKKVIYLDDDEVAVLVPDSLRFLDFRKKRKSKKISTIDWGIEKAQKDGFPHFMLKEINQQSESVTDSLRGRLVEKEGKVKLGGLEVLGDRTKKIKRVIITACGTSYYAGIAGKYMIENCSGIPVEVDLASEFRYRSPVLDKDTAILVVSQSGETADALAALNLAKRNKNLTLGIINTVGSSIARRTDAGVYNHIGPEIGVASTKAFTSQLAVLALFALYFARERGYKTERELREIIRSLYLLPSQIKKILKANPPIGGEIKKLAGKYSDSDNFLYMGRNYNYPAALEGALKLKEISYVHAEGYASGEMKHGPLALIDKNFPTFAIVGSPSSRIYEKILSNIEEIKARRGPVIAVAEEGDMDIQKIANDVVYIPKTIEMLNPILAVVPLQLFAYHMAVLRGYDPDKPRNLAKSVTVE